MNTSVKGMSKVGLKSNNVLAILSLLYKKGAVPRKDIAESVHLTPSAVTILTNDMIRSGLLVEGGAIHNDSRVGRRKVLIDINYRYGYIAGIYIKRTDVIVALSYMDGKSIAVKTIPSSEGGNPENTADRVTELVGELINENGLDRAKFLYAGVSIVGYVDPFRGISENSFGIYSGAVDLRGIYHSRLGVPVQVDDNVRALAIAETDYNRSAGKINGLFVKHGPGLGGAVIIDSTVFFGAKYHAAEIGHFTADPNGKKCFCGKRGCVSTLVSCQSLTEKAAGALDPDTTPSLWNLCRGSESKITLAMMLKSASAGDAPIARILDDAATQLAMVIENSMKLLDGDVVITFGGLFSDDTFRIGVERKLDALCGGSRSYSLRKSIISSDEMWKASVAIAVRQLLCDLSRTF
jgi:predicted NBD/HSP70 family sugar kinase